MDLFPSLIKEICHENGISCEILSYGWIYKLTKNGETRHIAGRHFDINPAAADKIACDKYACGTVLKNGGIPVIEHELFFNPVKRANWINPEGEWRRIFNYFEQNNNKVVVKPNNGWQGRNVFLCETAKELERAVNTIFLSEPNVCLCPYYDIPYEYRVFYVNRYCAHAYGKEAASVCGDGKNNVGELLKNSNIPEENVKSNVDTSYVPAKGERVRVSWKHNLSGGAISFEINDDTLLKYLMNMAAKAAQTINIRFATVDIAGLCDDTYRVMEINAGVTSNKLLEQCPEKYNLIKDIYSRAVLSMFGE